MLHMRRQSSKSIAAIRLSTALALPLVTSSPAVAEDPAQAVEQVEIDQLAQEAFALSDSDPESSVPSMEQAMRRPLQMGYFVILLIERGKAALDRGDAAAAVKYYRALVKAVPERSQSYSLLCKAYEAQADIQSALENCRTALGKEGVTVEDNLRFVEVLLKKPVALEARDIEDVEAVAGHLEQELGPEKDGPLVANRLRCGLGIRLEDVKRLEACTRELRKLAPKDAGTIAFSWALALKQRDFVAAERVMAEAKAAGLPIHALRKMQEGLAVAREGAGGWRRWLRDWYLLVGGTALLALGIFLLVHARRRRTLLVGHAA
jgi:tetratricopeptide (TPR) repeat protein